MFCGYSSPPRQIIIVLLALKTNFIVGRETERRFLRERQSAVSLTAFGGQINTGILYCISYFREDAISRNVFAWLFSGDSAVNIPSKLFVRSAPAAQWKFEFSWWQVINCRCRRNSHWNYQFAWCIFPSLNTFLLSLSQLARETRARVQRFHLFQSWNNESSWAFKCQLRVFMASQCVFSDDENETTLGSCEPLSLSLNCFVSWHKYRNNLAWCLNKFN